MTEISDGKKARKGKKPSSSGTIDCPMCGAKVPEDAEECPKCEEPFTPEAFLNAGKSKGTRFMFWAGLLTVLAGIGLALGSWLHDLMDLSIIGDGNPTSFGWLNRMVSLIGIIILVVGIILLIVSLSKMEKEDLEDMDAGNAGKEENNQGG